jgi:hypothetical protein
MSDSEFAKWGFYGAPQIVGSKALDMLKFPRPSIQSNVRNLGHPIRLAGKRGRHLRGKSKARSR